jgi:hypothetical protein
MANYGNSHAFGIRKRQEKSGQDVPEEGYYRSW